MLGRNDINDFLAAVSQADESKENIPYFMKFQAVAMWQIAGSLDEISYRLKLVLDKLIPEQRNTSVPPVAVPKKVKTKRI